MAGYTRNDTSNNIATGNIINSADLDGEFDALQSAFVATTGHNHDGTTGSGAPISTLGPTQEVVVTTATISPSADNTIDLGTSLLEFKDLYIDGTANIDSLVADTADINGGTIDNATIATSNITVGSGKTLDVSAGTLTLADNQISGDKVEGGTINATTITTLTSTTVNATTVNTTNIEATTIKAKDGTTAGTVANTTGVVTVTSLVATSADINGGTVDGTTIGASVPAAAEFTTVDAISLGVTNIKAKDGTAAGSIANSTGVVTLASSVLTTTDINGGTIDGATIGGSSAAAITGTTITATGDVTIPDKIIHAGDTNTAIRFPANDTVSVETGGVERFKVTDATTSVSNDLTVGGVLTGSALAAYREKITTVGTVSASTYNIDTDLSNIFDITLGNNVTFTFTNPPSSGFSKPVVLILRQDGTGSRTATFTGAKYTEGQLPTLSTGAGDIDVLSFFTIDGGTSWFGTFAMANVS
jgi:hypothetical protein